MFLNKMVLCVLEVAEFLDRKEHSARVTWATGFVFSHFVWVLSYSVEETA